VYFLIKWPYTDCSLFSAGDEVLYWVSNENTHLFWHPKRAWKLATRKNILKEAKILKQSKDLSEFNDVIF